MNFLCKNARLGYKTEYAMDFKNCQKMVAAVFIFIKNLNQLFKLGWILEIIFNKNNFPVSHQQKLLVQNLSFFEHHNL